VSTAHAVVREEAQGSTARDDRSRRNPWWGLAAPVIVGFAALLPLLFNRRFYFYADTQDGAYGIWYDIGRSVLSGEWPLFSVDGWMAGNHVAEGQWGLWNPLILGISVFVYLVPNAVISTTIIKIAFLMFAAGGAYLMTRSYEGNRPLAFVAGVAAPLAGFTLFMDAPSWVTNLFVWAFFPWVLWALRRMLWDGGGMLLPIVLGFLLVSIGYVHGTILLIALYLAIGIEIAVRRQWSRLLPVLYVGVIHGLTALTVYLPGVLSASVSARSTGVENSGFMVATLTGLATSGVPTGVTALTAWWGAFAAQPLHYIAWFLPLFAFVDFGRFAARWKSVTSLYALLVFTFLFIVGPSNVSALQFPIRVIPWFALCVIVLLAVMLSTAGVRFPSARRLAVALSIVFLGTYLALSQNPAGLKAHGLSFVLVSASIVVIWLLLRGRTATSGDVGEDRTAGFDRTALARAAVFIGLVTVAMTGLQSVLHARDLVSSLPAPAEEADYAIQLTDAEGEAFVAGSPTQIGPDILDETLLSNSWYLNDVPTHNLYSPVQFLPYAQDLCLSHTGIACQDAVEELFEVDSETRTPVADLLSVDSVQILRAPDQEIEDLEEWPVPDGWELTDTGDDYVLWVRDAVTPDAGEVVWASAGTEVTMVSNSDMQATFEVDAVGSDGGQVVLSRLAWPGYSASGASLGEPVRDYLLSVDVPSDSEGTEVTVTFAPPAWPLCLAAMALAGLLTIAALIYPLIRRRRRAAVESEARQD